MEQILGQTKSGHGQTIMLAGEAFPRSSQVRLVGIAGQFNGIEDGDTFSTGGSVRNLSDLSIYKSLGDLRKWLEPSVVPIRFNTNIIEG